MAFPIAAVAGAIKLAQSLGIGKDSIQGGISAETRSKASQAFQNLFGSGSRMKSIADERQAKSYGLIALIIGAAVVGWMFLKKIKL